MKALEYSAASLLQRIEQLQNQVVQLSTVLPMIPLAAAPLNPSQGNVAFSDGTSSIESFGASGEGVYRYTGSAWAFVG